MFWFRKKTPIPKEPGWVPDLADSHDFRHEEVLGAPSSISWQSIDSHPDPLFPIKDQDHSSSCVGQSVSKALGIVEYYESGVYRDLSARFPYAQRTYQGPGMYIREGMEFGIKQGCPLEHLLPSQGMNETQMNREDDIITDVRQTALVYKAKSFLYCDMTFDKIASILQQDIPVVLGVAGTNATWTNKKGWVLPPRSFDELWYHAMVITPENKKGKNYGLINGKKTLIVDNSWGANSSACYNGQVFFTEEYLPWIKWNFYFLNLPDNWRDKESATIEKPKHQFNRDLFYGLKNDPEVVWLQKCLKWYGVFPINISETGNYYSITSKAVQSFQSAENIAKLGDSGYGRCGPATRKVLNKLFG